MYSFCLFDFDYTLGDSTNGIVESANFALSEMGLPVCGKENIRRTVGMSLQESFTHLTLNHGARDRERYSELFRERADKVILQNTELLPDTVEVLSFLRSKGIKTGIVSTKCRYRIVEILDKFSIADLIDVIVGAEDVKNAKPHPEALLAAIKKLNAPDKNVLYVGDSLIDAKTARSAHVDFIAVTTGTTGKDEFLPFPHVAVIGALSELTDKALFA